MNDGPDAVTDGTEFENVHGLFVVTARGQTLRSVVHSQNVIRHPREQLTEPVYDERGVDRTLIREMLALEPEQRLRHIEAIVEDILAIWEENGTRPVR